MLICNSVNIGQQLTTECREGYIYFSSDFKGFNNALADNANTTVYVANAKIKATLRKELKKTNIAIGAPSEVQKFKITYSCSQGGSLDVWTKGAINVVSGQSLSAGSTVNFKTIPLFDYEVESWTFKLLPYIWQTALYQIGRAHV